MKMKRNIYKDGWHTVTGTFSFYVENGKLIKGLRYGDPFGPKLIYPYKWSKRLNCYDNVSGITARYGCWKNVTMKFILYIFIALLAFVMCGMCMYTAITSEDNNIKMLFCTIVSAAVGVVALLFAGGIIE